MGYCYETRTGRLCCDRCGNAGGVRRIRCKHDWCQPVALCPACRKAPGVLAEHRAHCDEHCKPAAAEAAKRSELEQGLFDAGAFVRGSAAMTPGGLVRVWFRDAAGTELRLDVTKDCYDSVPLLQPATPLDYGLGMQYAEAVAERDSISLPLARLRVSGMTAQARGETIVCVPAEQLEFA